MRHSGLVRTITLGAVALLVAATPGVVTAEEEIEGGGLDTYPQPAYALNLLAPVGNLLSGRAWLMTEGLDPSFYSAGKWDPLVGGPWRDLPSTQSGDARTQAAGASALVPFREPGPAFSGNVLVTRDFSQSPFQTEPHLAVNPDDPEHLVLGTIDYNFPSLSTYVSLDGGITWEGPNQVPYVIDDLGSGGDPVLSFDRSGAIHMATISIGEEELQVGPVTVFTQVSSIAVSTSEDDGYTWPRTISTARSGVNTADLAPDRFGRLRGNLSIGFLDKPWLDVGPDPENPDQDVIYVTYTEFDVNYEVVWIGELPTLVPNATRTTIRLVASRDGGLTWTNPVAVSPTVQQAYGQEGAPSGIPGVLGTRRTVQGSQPIVGPDGTVYVAWLDSTDDETMKGVGEIHISRSTDGGATFSTPAVASSFNEIPFRPRNAFFRYWASEFPQIAVAPDDKIYITYVAKPSDRPRDDGDVFVVSSTDKGDTWSRPTRLNDDDKDATQFFPSIDVDPAGSVHVMWGDMRDDPSATRYHIYYTRSDDQGETWGFVDEELDIRSGDTRVSDFGSNPNRGFPFGLFIGDYFSIKATEEDVYMVWADTRLGEFGSPNQKIGFARRQAIPSPELFVSPPAGPGGQEVTLQGFGFQPNLNVFVQLGDATVALARTDEEGTFENTFYMPVTGEGAQTLTVLDESGNSASTSYFTEFGFGTIQEQYQDLAAQLEELRNSLGGAPPAQAPSPAEGTEASAEPSPADGTEASPTP
jgi:hypothetical protein